MVHANQASGDFDKVTIYRVLGRAYEINNGYFLPWLPWRVSGKGDSGYPHSIATGKGPLIGSGMQPPLLNWKEASLRNTHLHLFCTHHLCLLLMASISQTWPEPEGIRVCWWCPYGPASLVRSGWVESGSGGAKRRPRVLEPTEERDKGLGCFSICLY